MPKTAKDHEANQMLVLNRAAAQNEVRPSATPIPVPPAPPEIDVAKAAKGIDAQDVMGGDSQLKFAQQQRQQALDAGDAKAVEAWDKEIRKVNQGRLGAAMDAQDASQTGLFGVTEYDNSMPLFDQKLDAEEARLAAEYKERDTAMQQEVARAEREAMGYHDMTFDQKKAEAGIAEGWAPKELPPAAPRVIGSVEGWEDEAALRSMRQAAEGGDDADLVAALGEEGASKFKQLDRARNSSNPQRADAASAEFDALFGNLTPEQERLIYGDPGNPRPTTDQLDALILAHSDVGTLDPGYLAVLAARQLDADGLARIQQGLPTFADQAALIRMQGARRGFAEAGVSTDQIPDAMVRGLADTGLASKGQAAELVQNFMDAMQQARTPPFDEPPSVKAAQQLADLSSTLRQVDNGKLKGVSKKALDAAEKGDPEQALAEATDYANRRMAEIDNKIESIKQRAIEEGC
jgi:hypothetical protein